MKIIKNRQINNLSSLSNCEIWIPLEKLIKKTCLRIEFRHREGFKMLIWRCYINIYIELKVLTTNFGRQILKLTCVELRYRKSGVTEFTCACRCHVAIEVAVWHRKLSWGNVKLRRCVDRRHGFCLHALCTMNPSVVLNFFIKIQI